MQHANDPKPDAPAAPADDAEKTLVLLGPADCLAEAGVEAAVRGLEEAGWSVRRVEVGDDAAAAVREAAVVAGRGTLVTFGGDGSLHAAAGEVLRAEHACSLALVPDGTGNDFARHLGLAGAAPGDALLRVLSWPVRAIDVIRVESPAGRPRRAVNAVSFGAIAGTTRSTPDAVKAVAGKTAYAAWGAAVAAVASGTGVRVAGERADGGAFSWEGSALGVIASNGAFTGGGFHVAPGARLASGRFEVLILPEVGVADRYRLSRELREPEEDGPGADDDAGESAAPEDWPPEPLVAASLVELRVEADEPLPVNADGEPSDADTLVLELEPAALRVRVHASA